jgi:hypothetical protein
MESHGGSTYCAVAALSLMGTLDVLSPAQHDKLVRWCAFRLNVGFQVQLTSYNRAPGSQTLIEFANNLCPKFKYVFSDPSFIIFHLFKRVIFM